MIVTERLYYVEQDDEQNKHDTKRDCTRQTRTQFTAESGMDSHFNFFFILHNSFFFFHN